MKAVPGLINFGGGVAEQYIGKVGGDWQIFREDERYCVLTRYGQAHPPHEHEYWYTRTKSLGGIIRGHMHCEGLKEDTEPWPLCPIGHLFGRQDPEEA